MTHVLITVHLLLITTLIILPSSMEDVSVMFHFSLTKRILLVILVLMLLSRLNAWFKLVQIIGGVLNRLVSPAKVLLMLIQLSILVMEFVPVLMDISGILLLKNVMLVPVQKHKIVVIKDALASSLKLKLKGVFDAPQLPTLKHPTFLTPFATVPSKPCGLQQQYPVFPVIIKSDRPLTMRLEHVLIAQFYQTKILLKTQQPFPRMIHVSVLLTIPSSMVNADVMLQNCYMIWEIQLDVEHVLKLLVEVLTIRILEDVIVLKVLNGIILPRSVCVIQLDNF